MADEDSPTYPITRTATNIAGEEVIVIESGPTKHGSGSKVVIPKDTSGLSKEEIDPILPKTAEHADIAGQFGGQAPEKIIRKRLDELVVGRKNK